MAVAAPSNVAILYIGLVLAKGLFNSFPRFLHSAGIIVRCREPLLIKKTLLLKDILLSIRMTQVQMDRIDIENFCSRLQHILS